MYFSEQVKGIVDEPKITPPSKWHVIYYLKWYFVVRPRLIKELNKAKAELVDDILHSQLLRDRTK